MYTGKYFIEKLHLEPHPEGGYFKRFLEAKDTVDGERKLWSSIYYLLKDREVSNFHRLNSDEIWYYHSGSSMVLYIIGTDGMLRHEKLGLDIEHGEQPQIIAKKGEIFGAVMEGTGYSLVSCMVSPEFKYEEFELLERKDLLEKYPQYEQIIKRLTR